MVGVIAFLAFEATSGFSSHHLLRRLAGAALVSTIPLISEVLRRRRRS